MSTTTVALSLFTLQGSRIDTIAKSVVSVKVYCCVKAGHMTVFGGSGCAVFSLEPVT